MEDPARIDFEFISHSGDEYGEYFETTNRIAIYLRPHSECIENLMATITHELLHKMIGDFVEDIDIEQEHRLIKHMMGFDQDLMY